MATQAEINKLWAEQLAKAGGTREAADMLEKQGLAMGLTQQQLNIAGQSAFNANREAAANPVKSDGGDMPSMRPASSNLGLGGNSNAWNGGAAATDSELANARGWVKGKTSEEIAAKGKELGLTADQFGSVFGNTGAEATNVGYGTEGGLKDNAKGQTWDGSKWVQTAPTTSTNLGLGTPPPAIPQTAAQTQTVSAGPAATAQAQGYEAQNTNLAGQYQAMGLSDPSQANARLLSGQVNNPYLDQQANNITQRLNKNLQENILPGIGQGAQMAGGYGGSRQGIAQGKAIGETQDNLANALTNMYSSANEAAQGRMSTAAGNLSGIGAQVGIANTSGQNQAAQFGANAQNTAGMFNAGQQNSMGQFNAGQTNQGNQFNAGQQNNYNLGLMGNQTQNKSIDNAWALGQGNLALGNRAQDNSYALGQGNLANQQNATSNAYTLGQGNLALGNRAQDNSYNLGQGNLALGNRAQDNSYTLGQGNLALGNKQADNSYQVGMANVGVAGQNAANSAAANQNSYNLGMSQLDSTNQRFGQQFGLDTMNSMYNWANGGVNAMNGMQQQPVNYFNNFSGNANQIAGQGGTNTSNQNLTGNPWLGAAGGYQLANKWLGA